jgi:Transposase DDE domain
MNKNTTKLALMEYLKPFHHRSLTNFVQFNGLNRYVKKFDRLKAIKLFTFAQLMQIPSYTAISLTLSKKKKLQKALGLSSISISQLSRSWRDVDDSLLAYVFQHMKQAVVKQWGAAKAKQKLDGLHLIDASLIMLTLSRYRWATYSKHKSAIKLHLKYIDAKSGSYPDQVILTTGNCNDKTQMEPLLTKDPDVLNVFDRGYVDYRLFDTCCEENVRFVTRLRHNADYIVIQNRPVDAQSGVQGDAVIGLGYRNTRYKMKHPLRLVECLDLEGKPFRIFTNDFRMEAHEIAEIYRRRWQIELFFKWIKQHFYVKKCYGTSRNAVFNQIYTAMIAYCLLILTQKKAGFSGPLVQVLHHFKESWDGHWRSFQEGLFRPPKRSSRGRRKPLDAERLFLETVRQYIAGDTEYFDEIMYDPLI